MVNRAPVGAVILAWRVWTRLPPEARRSMLIAARSQGMRMARTHGPRIATVIAARAVARRRRD
jgi:hypothetical protein